jgi:hypothetical protein
MAKTADFGSKLIRATQGIRRPSGIAAQPRVVIGVDATDMPAAWLYFGVDDTKAQPSKLLAFQRLVERAASTIDPSVVTYVRFAPGTITAPKNSPPARKTAPRKTAAKSLSGAN